MAVATHVSRVAKEYAPYGYSIVEDVAVRFGALTHGGDHKLVALAPTDADIYVESATLVFDTVAAANADWDVSIYNETDGAALNSAAVATGSVAALTPQAITINQHQTVAVNDLLVVWFDDDGSAGASPTGSVIIRYRRQA